MPWASHSAAILRTSVTPPVLATSGIRGNSRVSTTSRPCEKASPQPTVSRTRVRPATSSSSRSSFCADASARANLYLASKYAGPMHCVDPKALGLATQWSFWAMLRDGSAAARFTAASRSVARIWSRCLPQRGEYPCVGQNRALGSIVSFGLARWLDSCLARPVYGRVRDRTRRK